MAINGQTDKLCRSWSILREIFTIITALCFLLHLNNPHIPLRSDGQTQILSERVALLLLISILLIDIMKLFMYAYCDIVRMFMTAHRLGAQILDNHLFN